MLLWLGSAWAGTGRPPGNLAVIETLLRGILGEAKPHLALQDSTTLQLTSPAERAAWEWLVEKTVYEVLARPHHLTVQQHVPAGTGTARLTWAPLDLSIQYSGTRARGKNLVRSVTCRLWLQYTDSHGTVVWADEMTRTNSDTLDVKSSELLEDPVYPFTRGAGRPRSGLQKFWEPFFVTAITGGIIYLFYAFRSN